MVEATRRFSFYINELQDFLNLRLWSTLRYCWLGNLVMKHHPILSCAFSLVVATPSWATAEVWLCKRGDIEEYTNVGDTKNCRKLDLPGITTVPAAKAAPAPVRSAPSASNVRPADFPKVDASTQRSRDDDRRKLLEDELREQETRLVELRRSGNATQPEQLAQITRVEANIVSLKRELSRINN